MDITDRPVPSRKEAFLKKLECPVDDNAGYQNDRWTNRDLIPIPPERRTYKIWSFCVGICLRAHADATGVLGHIWRVYFGIFNRFEPARLWYVSTG